jgi:hypothetical protein
MTVSQAEFASNFRLPLSGATKFSNTGTNSITVYKANGTIQTLVDATVNFPATSDVRNGIAYASGTLTGTLIVPSPSNVRQGVPTDNTVGTAALTPADFWNYLVQGVNDNTFGKLIIDNLDNPVSSVPASTITALGTSTDPIALRLQNVATVQTTGDQIAAAL